MSAKPKPEVSRVLEQKWTAPLIAAGYTSVPNVFFEHQKALGLDALDINILLHLMSYWWSPSSKAFPSKVTIAGAIGVDPRTVQRRIAAMEVAKLVQRMPRKRGLTNIYCFDGLIDAARPYAWHMIQERQRARSQRANSQQRKGNPKLWVIK
jgi:hypothetical protein